MASPRERVAHVCRALPSVPWHAVGDLDEPRVERRVRHRDPAHRRDRRRDVRPDRRMPRRRCVPAAGVARPVPHRGRRHDRRSAERPRPPPAARRRRLRRPGDPDVPTRLGGRSRPRGVRRTRSAPRRDHRARHHPVGRLPRRAVRPPQARHLARRHRHRSRAPVGVHGLGRRGDGAGSARSGAGRHARRGRQGDCCAGRCSSRWRR